MSNLFAEPTRQSPVAIILLIYKYFINIIRQFWPAIIAVFIGQRSGNVSNLILISVIVVAVSALIFAIASYLRFSFKVQGDELFIEKGVFKKSKLNIPFERIQTLNFEQGLLHQIFDVVRIEVDTAGSAKNEFSFNAIQKNLAEELRTLILERKTEIEVVEPSEQAEDLPIKEELKTIFSLDLKDLFIVGLTQNHLRTLVLLFFFALWGMGELSDAGFDLDWINKESATALIESGVVIILSLVFILLILIILGTAIRTILTYYEFKMFRTDKGFKIQSGLLNRKEYAALDYKIQQIKWVNNPLKRIFKIHHLQLKQASSIAVSSKKSIKVPGINLSKINEIVKYLFRDKNNYSELETHKISVLYLYRNLAYIGILPWVIIFGMVFYITNRPESYFILLAIPYFSITTWFAYRKWAFRINDDLIYTHHGIFENKNNLVQLYKIQNVQIHQSPFQWRRNLANIRMFTAAGSVLIPYVKYEEALKIKDLVLYQIETNELKWY
ncbi:PH domain-containing protein [Portibacter lacus]|uniref:Membrane protein n=1 Tax=Portibacter lacus TaxID=1099794 RepID=A0AA37SPM6_9BACT|nr:PH domain-containing protein [Portibacter lacus]GLR17650.1 membrane protein [Portibacter lacus]